MSGAGHEDAVAARLAEFEREVGRLRREVGHAQAVSAAALSRATRLAQVVSALVQLTDPQEILERAAGEVAEQFGADVAAFLVRAGDVPGARLRLAAHWGIPDRSLPVAIDDPPAYVTGLDPAQPLAGPAEKLGVPAWLRPSDPRHLLWARLAVRGEHLGFMLLARRGDEPFSAADVQEMGLVVSRIALAVDNGRLYSRTQEQVRRLQRLHEVAAMLTGALEVERVVDLLATTVVDEVPVTGVAVYLAGKPGLVLAARAGAISDPPGEIADDVARSWPDGNLMLLGVGGPPVGALLLTGRPPPGTEADSFLQHLADLGSLTIGKSLLFERIRTQAESDPLTGLPNRAVLMGRLESAVSDCRARGSDLAVIFVDLDGFKTVNDTYGHDVGDHLLISVAARLTDVAGPEDTVARLGGDEFILVRVDTSTEEAFATAERIRSAMATPFELGDVIVVNKASVGVSMASTSSYHPKTIMREADNSMYADKLRDHQRPPEPALPATTRLRPRARGLPLAAIRRTAHPGQPAGPPPTRPTELTTAPPADNLRSWCGARSGASGRGINDRAAEAVHRILSIAREQLDMELAWLSRFVDGRQVFEAFEGDPSRFALSAVSELGLRESYCVRVLDGRLPAVVPDTSADQRTAQLPLTLEHRLGAYVGAPVFARRGQLYGMLCAVSREPEPSLRHRDGKFLRMLAGMLTEPLTAHLARDAQCSAFTRNALAMLDAGGMTVDLQPIIDLATGETVSVEALARFATYPYSVEGWFAQAHQAGCGHELEIDAVLNALHVLDLLPAHLTLAVNASPDVACSPGLLAVVSGTDPTRTVVEITEHRRASEPSMYAAAILRLKGQGVRVAIDDAGTGYSDLRQVLQLQPDILKLDRTLIDGVDRDPVKVALVRALVAFTKDTGMRLVAEGISSDAIRAVLCDLHVDYGQGYELGPPEPADRVLTRIRAASGRG